MDCWWYSVSYLHVTGGDTIEMNEYCLGETRAKSSFLRNEYYIYIVIVKWWLIYSENYICLSRIQC